MPSISKLCSYYYTLLVYSVLTLLTQHYHQHLHTNIIQLNIFIFIFILDPILVMAGRPGQKERCSKFLPELKAGGQYYQSISNFAWFSMLENIKGFCCHYGGFCEKENFIKTTYIYNKISKQIWIAIYIIILLL